MTARPSRPSQPRLLPDEPTTDEVVLALLGVVRGFGGKDRGLMSLIVNGEQHTPRCPRGQWLTPGGPRPDGDPCSERCATAQQAVAWATAWIMARKPTAREMGRKAG